MCITPAMMRRQCLPYSGMQMNNDAQAPKGRNVNNPVRKRGGSRHLSAFRAAYCRCILENPCAARVQGGACSAKVVLSGK
jgi:hypothetical protein